MLLLKPIGLVQKAEGEPAGCDRSRIGITGEQQRVAQRLPPSCSPVPEQRGSGAGSRAPDSSPAAHHRQLFPHAKHPTVTHKYSGRTENPYAPESKSLYRISCNTI